MLVFLNTDFNFVVGCKLISDHSPILHFTAVPFFAELGNSEIEQLEECVFVREGTFFGDLLINLGYRDCASLSVGHDLRRAT